MSVHRNRGDVVELAPQLTKWHDILHLLYFMVNRYRGPLRIWSWKCLEALTQTPHCMCTKKNFINYDTFIIRLNVDEALAKTQKQLFHTNFVIKSSFPITATVGEDLAGAPTRKPRLQ